MIAEESHSDAHSRRCQIVLNQSFSKQLVIVKLIIKLCRASRLMVRQLAFVLSFGKESGGWPDKKPFIRKRHDVTM